ncbi:MAG: hypothetical protein PVI26_08080 [Chitinispirillia bacterium]|jgi:hypothetical protein
MKQKQNTTFIITGIIVISIIIWAIILIPYYKNSNIFNPAPHKAFQYNLDTLRLVDTALINYTEQSPIKLNIENPAAITFDNLDRLYIAVSHKVIRRDSSASSETIISTDEPIHCIYFDENNTLYAGFKDRLTVYDKSGTGKLSWPTNEKKSHITSIARSKNIIFIADAGMRIVWSIDTTGKYLRKIGEKDPSKNIPGFIVPNPHMDMVIGRDGSLWVVNPGRHRIENFRPNGDLISFWGKYGVDIKGFCGCCNPVHLALLPDGSFVTSEKGLTRVKVYSPSGILRSVVAEPIIFHPRASGLDIAVNSYGKIYLLESYEKKIRIFKKKE